MRTRVAMRVMWLFLMLVPVTLVDPAPLNACTNKSRSYGPAMKSDLKNLSMAQEAFFADSGRYTSSLTQLDSTYFRPSTGVDVVLEHGDSTGWRARATHQAVAMSCVISMMNDRTVVTDGVPVCDPNPDDVKANSAHRWRFFAYLAFMLAGIGGLMFGRGRPMVVAALVVFGVVNPYWMDPVTGMDCGASTRAFSMVWIGLGAALAAWSLLKDPAQRSSV